MRIIKIQEKSINKMYGIAEQISEAMEEFMECLDNLNMGNREEEMDQEQDWNEEYSDEMEGGNRYGGGYREHPSSMGNRGYQGSGYRRGMGHRGEIANRRGVKGTGRYSRY